MVGIQSVSESESELKDYLGTKLESRTSCK
jgi:hypothetical protein